MAAALAAQQGVQAGFGIANALIAAIPGKQEKALNQQLEADQRKLSSGHSMSKGQRDTAAAGANQAISARTQQMLAQLSRGSAGGASGLQQANIAAALKGSQEAGKTVASDVNAMDMAGLAALKADVAHQRQQVMAMKEKNLEKGMAGAQQALGGAGSGSTPGTGAIGYGQTRNAAGLAATAPDFAKPTSFIESDFLNGPPPLRYGG